MLLQDRVCCRLHYSHIFRWMLLFTNHSAEFSSDNMKVHKSVSTACRFRFFHLFFTFKPCSAPRMPSSGMSLSHLLLLPRWPHLVIWFEIVSMLWWLFIYSPDLYPELQIHMYAYSTSYLTIAKSVSLPSIPLGRQHTWLSIHYQFIDILLHRFTLFHAPYQVLYMH